MKLGGAFRVNRTWMMGREERFYFNLIVVILLFNYPIGIWHMSDLSKNFPIWNTEATRKANADSFILWSLNLSRQHSTIIALSNGWFLFQSLVLLAWMAQTWLFSQSEQISRWHFCPRTEGTFADADTSPPGRQNIGSLWAPSSLETLPCHVVVRNCPLLMFELPSSLDQHGLE